MRLLLVFFLNILAVWPCLADSNWKFKDANTSYGQLNGTWRYLPVADRWRKRPQQIPPISQWRVDPSKGELVTFVLPLKASEAEFGYLRNQLTMFERYLDFTGIREILILMPTDGIPKAMSTLQEVIKSLKRIQTLPIRLAPEGLSVPDLLEGSTAAARFSSAKGWVRQQIVKMGAAELVETPFVLMLDADIFLLRKMSGLDLFKISDCTATSIVCDSTGAKEFKAYVDLLPINFGDKDSLRWWGNSAMVLQLNATFGDWKKALGITPQVVSADLFKELGSYIQRRFEVPSWRAYLLDIAKRWDDHQFELRGEWLHDPAFTEWSLLYIYGMHSDKFFKSHTEGRLLQGNEVWHDDAWEDWDPCKVKPGPKSSGYFSLVQSRMEKRPDDILDRLKECWTS